jgi:hypothetical protein
MMLLPAESQSYEMAAAWNAAMEREMEDLNLPCAWSRTGQNTVRLLGCERDLQW